MAPKLKSSAQSLLHLNILTIVKLEGSSSQMKEYVKPGIFSKINRPAFEHTMHFLIKAYDLQLCRSAFSSWPIVERQSQERVFRREVVEAVKKIASLEPSFPLANFSNSFLSSPGGDRLENYLCRLSCLALRNVLLRRNQPASPHPPRELQPQRCLAIVKSQRYHTRNVVAKKLRRFLAFVEHCDNKARELRDTLASNQHTLNTLRAGTPELNLAESTSAEDILSAEAETELCERLNILLNSMKAIENQEMVVARCGSAVRMVTDDQRARVVLEPEDHLDLAALFGRTVDAVKSLSARLMPWYDNRTPDMLAQLEEFSTQFSKISVEMEENLKSVVELVAAAGSSAEVVEPNVDSPGRFRHACQLLDEAGHATPPLEFRPAISNPTWRTLSSDTESPPITSVADLLGAQKSVGGNGTTQSLMGKKPLLSEKFGSTPARPRSEIPVKFVPKSARSLVQNPNETPQKVVASRLLSTVESTEVSTMPLRSSKIPIGKEGLDIPRKSQLNKEDSTQDVLDIAVSILSPGPSRNASLKDDASVKEAANVKIEKKFADFSFSGSLSDEVVKKEFSAEPDKLLTDKKIKRKSMLELIARCKNIVPVNEDSEPVVNDESEPEEWKDSDIDISLGSDFEVEFDGNDLNQRKFELSPGF